MLVVGSPFAGQEPSPAAGAASLYGLYAVEAAIAGCASVVVTVDVTQEVRLLIPEVGEMKPRPCVEGVGDD